jgi:hypothetical protein
LTDAQVCPFIGLRPYKSAIRIPQSAIGIIYLLITPRNRHTLTADMTTFSLTSPEKSVIIQKLDNFLRK